MTVVPTGHISGISKSQKSWVLADLSRKWFQDKRLLTCSRGNRILTQRLMNNGFLLSNLGSAERFSPGTNTRMAPRDLSFVFRNLRWIVLGLNLHVNSRWEIKGHQSVDRLFSRFRYVDKTFVHSHLVLFASILVDERRSVNRIFPLLRRKWDRAMNLGTRSLGSLDDGHRGLIDDLVIVGADTNANPLFFRLFFRFCCGFGHNSLKKEQMHPGPATPNRGT